MNRILSYISVAVILLSACVKQSDGGNGNRREIHFAAAVGTYSTKAMDTSFEQGDAIGISANDPVGLVNQKLTINDGKLTPESTLYWPVSQLSTQKADFYAYYPYAQDRDLSKGIDFTVKADQSTHTLFTASDLMTAFTSASPSDEAVSLLFTHRLTKIVLKIDNQLESDIADVYVGNVRGRATVKANEDPVVEGTRGTIKACPVTLEGNVKAWTLVVVPQTANLRLMITTTDQKQYTYSLAEAVELKPGYRYTAAITINAESHSSDFTSEVTEWTDNADTQFSGVIKADSIKEVLEADDNTQVCIEGIVHALSTRSFVLYDGDASINVYTTSAPTCTIGDKVKVQGVKVHYQYVPEISSPTVDVLSSGNELLEINYAGINQGFETFSSPVTIPVELTGTLSISKPVSRTYYDIAVAGVEGVKGAMYWPTEDLGVEAWNGKEVTVRGFYFGYRTSSGVKYHDIIVTSVAPSSSVSASRYLTFTSEGHTTISLNNYEGNAPVLYYSTDKEKWTRWDYSALTFSSTSPLYLFGDNPDGLGKGYYMTSTFVDAGDLYSVSGDIMSLLDGENAMSAIPAGAQFIGLFDGCTRLVSPPELPATSLTEDCYARMFQNCSNLKTAPELPATVMKEHCYGQMFLGCSNLTLAPSLPAATLAEFCYEKMFMYCSKLISAPALPATDLANCCYSTMFYGCSSMTTAPNLPATTLTASCYEAMFSQCTQLKYIKCLATDMSAAKCTKDWLAGVAATGIFVKAPTAVWSQETGSGIPSGWTVKDDGESGDESGSEDIVIEEW